MASHDQHTEHGQQQDHGGGMSAYARLFISLGLSLLTMFALTMIMVDRFDHVYLNLSNFYMAVIMVAPMGLIMLGVMWHMFRNRTLNIALIIGFLALFAIAIWMGRSSVGVGNEQFLKSMIPHHSRAILVCEEASITDPEIQQLCDEIIQTQEEEIRIMEDMLEGR